MDEGESVGQIFVASLMQKDGTQATVVRKLSSYTRQNQTKKALWELDNILRSIYILDFIDNPASKNKSVWLTPQGLERGRRIAERLFSANSGNAG